MGKFGVAGRDAARERYAQRGHGNRHPRYPGGEKPAPAWYRSISLRGLHRYDTTLNDLFARCGIHHRCQSVCSPGPVSGRSHIETCASCTVSLTTSSRSEFKVSRSVSEPQRERFQRIPRVVLAAVKAPVDEGLDAPSQRVEQGGDSQGGDDHGELGKPFLAGNGAEERLDRHDAAEVDQRERDRKGPVDEGTVYDYVYVVEAVLDDGYA